MANFVALLIQQEWKVPVSSAIATPRYVLSKHAVMCNSKWGYYVREFAPVNLDM